MPSRLSIKSVPFGGVPGAPSRDGLKAVVIQPVWDALTGGTPNQLGSAQLSFSRVPLVFRATRLRCNSLCRVPVHVYEGETEVDEWPYETDLNDLIWKTEAANLLAGGAFWLHLKNKAKFDKGVQWLNPFTVTVKWDGQNRTFSQQIGSKHFPADKDFWTEEEVLFWREFNPSDDISFGVSAAGVALGDAQLMHYLTRFAATFFEGGAMPITVLGLASATPDPERERIENFFKRVMTGIRNAFRVLAVRGEFNPQILTPPLKDLAIPDLRSQAIDSVAWAFDVPRTMLTADAANYATATSDFNGFITQTIVPRAKYFQENINQFLDEAGTGYSVELVPEEMTELQADENERATAFSQYVSGGMDKRVAAAVLGIDIPESVMPIWEAQGEAADAARTQLQALPPSNGDGKNPSPGNGNGNGNMQQDMAAGKALEREQFKRWAKKRLKAGKALYPFDWHYITDPDERDSLMASMALPLDEAASAPDSASPFQEYRIRLASLQEGTDVASQSGVD